MNKISSAKITSIILLLVAITILNSGEVLAGPPFFTDDPEPVEPGHWEIYTAAQYLGRSNNSLGTLPQFEINYGVFRDTMLHVVLPFSFNAQSGANASFGFGQVELGIKYRFIQETESMPQAGTFLVAELPSGFLGQSDTQFFIPLWFQKSFGTWTTYGGGGYWINPGSDNMNWVYLGWLLQNDLSKELTAGVELFYRSADHTGGKDSIGFNLGGQLNITDTEHLLFSAGRDISGDNLFTAYLAMQWTF